MTQDPRIVARSAAELRSRFVEFFAERGHTVVPSASLVPAGDQTLLFTNSGMVQFKDALSGSETRSLHIANYHRTMMERAAESIDLFPSEDRDISSLTLCLGADGVHRLKERIQRFRRELLEMSALEDDPARVIQINFQLFPLTTDRTEGSE